MRVLSQIGPFIQINRDNFVIIIKLAQSKS